MAVLCLVAMVWYNTLLALIFAAMMLGGYLVRKTQRPPRAAVDPTAYGLLRRRHMYKTTLSGRVWRFDSLKTLMAKASLRVRRRAGGLIAGSAEERMAAKIALAEVRSRRFSIIR